MIIEKLLPQELEDEIFKIMTANGFPWYWNAENIVPATPDSHIFQFTHVFYIYQKVYSSYFNIANMIVGYFAEKTKLKIKRVVRVKGNLIPDITHTPESLNNLIHGDIEDERDGKYVSFVYYVMDSDGDTIIYDDNNNIVETSPPIKGNCIWFDSKTKHRSSVPLHHKRRVVINFILEVE